MKRTVLMIVGLFLLVGGMTAQEVVTYANKDGNDLKMTIYLADASIRQPETIIYMFGGGFFTGSRDGKAAVEYCTKMRERGFTTISIDYRLGLHPKDTTQAKAKASIQEFVGAMEMAVQDLSSAVAFLIREGKRWGVDKDRIIITGCSAGAVTVLNADYCHANGSEWTKELPEDFRFYGVMAYAGAVFSTEGKIQWRKHQPAPTMLYHGTKDKTVTYRQIEFFNLGFYGTNSLAKRFKKYGYPVKVRRFEGLKHKVCKFGSRYVEDAVYFIENWVRKGKKWTCDEVFVDAGYKEDGKSVLQDL